MDRWTPAEVDAHIQYMRDFATKLEGSGEYVDGQALESIGRKVAREGIISDNFPPARVHENK